MAGLPMKVLAMGGATSRQIYKTGRIVLDSAGFSIRFPPPALACRGYMAVTSVVRSLGCADSEWCRWI